MESGDCGLKAWASHRVCTGLYGDSLGAHVVFFGVSY